MSSGKGTQPKVHGGKFKLKTDLKLGKLEGKGGKKGMLSKG